MTLPSARRNRYLRVPSICEICTRTFSSDTYSHASCSFCRSTWKGLSYRQRKMPVFHASTDRSGRSGMVFHPDSPKRHAVPPASLILYPAFPYRTASLSPICTLGVFPVFIRCSVQLSFSFHHRDEKSITRMNARIELDVSLFQAVFLKINPQTTTDINRLKWIFV